MVQRPITNAIGEHMLVFGFQMLLELGSGPRFGKTPTKYILKCILDRPNVSQQDQTESSTFQADPYTAVETERKRRYLILNLFYRLCRDSFPGVNGSDVSTSFMPPKSLGHGWGVRFFFLFAYPSGFLCEVSLWCVCSVTAICKCVDLQMASTVGPKPVWDMSLYGSPRRFTKVYHTTCGCSSKDSPRPGHSMTTCCLAQFSQPSLHALMQEMFVDQFW